MTSFGRRSPSAASPVHHLHRPRPVGLTVLPGAGAPQEGGGPGISGAGRSVWIVRGGKLVEVAIDVGPRALQPGAASPRRLSGDISQRTAGGSTASPRRPGSAGSPRQCAQRPQSADRASPRMHHTAVVPSLRAGEPDSPQHIVPSPRSTSPGFSPRRAGTGNASPIFASMAELEDSCPLVLPPAPGGTSSPPPRAGSQRQAPRRLSLLREQAQAGEQGPPSDDSPPAERGGPQMPRRVSRPRGRGSLQGEGAGQGPPEQTAVAQADEAWGPGGAGSVPDAEHSPQLLGAGSSALPQLGNAPRPSGGPAAHEGSAARRSSASSSTGTDPSPAADSPPEPGPKEQPQARRLSGMSRPAPRRLSSVKWTPAPPKGQAPRSRSPHTPSVDPSTAQSSGGRPSLSGGFSRTPSPPTQPRPQLQRDAATSAGGSPVAAGAPRQFPQPRRPSRDPAPGAPGRRQSSPRPGGTPQRPEQDPLQATPPEAGEGGAADRPGGAGAEPAGASSPWAAQGQATPSPLPQPPAPAPIDQQRAAPRPSQPEAPRAPQQEQICSPSQQPSPRPAPVSPPAIAAQPPSNDEVPVGGQLSPPQDQWLRAVSEGGEQSEADEPGGRNATGGDSASDPGGGAPASGLASGLAGDGSGGGPQELQSPTSPTDGAECGPASGLSDAAAKVKLRGGSLAATCPPAKRLSRGGSVRRRASVAAGPVPPSPAVPALAQAPAAAPSQRRPSRRASSRELPVGRRRSSQRRPSSASDSPGPQQSLVVRTPSEGPFEPQESPAERAVSPADSPFDGSFGFQRGRAQQRARSLSFAGNAGGARASLNVPTSDGETLGLPPLPQHTRSKSIGAAPTAPRKRSEAELGAFLRSKDWQKSGVRPTGQTQGAKPLKRPLWHDQVPPEWASELVKYKAADDEMATSEGWLKYLRGRKQRGQHAVICCVGEYLDPSIPSVSCALRDAEEGRVAFERAGYTVDLLCDGAEDFLLPTRDNLLRVITLALRNAKYSKHEREDNEQLRTAPLPGVVVLIEGRGFEGSPGHRSAPGSSIGSRVLLMREALHSIDAKSQGLISLNALMQLRDAEGRKMLMVGDCWGLPGGIKGSAASMPPFATLGGYDAAGGELDCEFQQDKHEGGALIYYFLKAIRGKAAARTGASFLTVCAINTYMSSRLLRHKTITVRTEASHLGVGASGGQGLIDREHTAVVKTDLRAWLRHRRWQRARFWLEVAAPPRQWEHPGDETAGVLFRSLLLRDLCRQSYRSNTPPKEQGLQALRVCGATARPELLLTLTKAAMDTQRGTQFWKEAVGTWAELPSDRTLTVTQMRGARALHVRAHDSHTLRRLCGAAAARSPFPGGVLESAQQVVDVGLVGTTRDFEKVDKMIRLGTTSRAGTLLAVITSPPGEEVSHAAAQHLQRVWRGFRWRRRVRLTRAVHDAEAGRRKLLVDARTADFAEFWEHFRTGAREVVLGQEEAARDNNEAWEREDRVRVTKRAFTGWQHAATTSAHSLSAENRQYLLNLVTSGAGADLDADSGRIAVSIAEEINRVLLHAIGGQLQIWYAAGWDTGGPRAQNISRTQVLQRFAVAQAEYAGRINIHRQGTLVFNHAAARQLRVENDYRPVRPVTDFASSGMRAAGQLLSEAEDHARMQVADQEASARAGWAERCTKAQTSVQQAERLLAARDKRRERELVRRQSEYRLQLQEELEEEDRLREDRDRLFAARQRSSLSNAGGY